VLLVENGFLVGLDVLAVFYVFLWCGAVGAGDVQFSASGYDGGFDPYQCQVLSIACCGK